MNAFNRSTLRSALGFFAGGTHMKVSALNPKTRRLSARYAATVLKSVATDLDGCKSLLLMPDNGFVRGQIATIKFFEDILSSEQLEKNITDRGLQAPVLSAQDPNTIRQAFDAYEPFLWLRFKTRNEGAAMYGQFELVDSENLSTLLLVEQLFDYAVEGVNDQNSWYPLFNALIDYIEQHSLSWSSDKTIAA